MLPAMRVEKLHEKQKQGDESKQARRPFTMEEIQKILSVADQEWKEIIFFGLYTGQRLGDLANLKWENIHLAEEELRFRTIKTNRYVILPLAHHPAVQRWKDGLVEGFVLNFRYFAGGFVFKSDLRSGDVKTFFRRRLRRAILRMCRICMTR